jgi:DNA helicase-2/ATP-dependent DNA helicase PcrA
MVIGNFGEKEYLSCSYFIKIKKMTEYDNHIDDKVDEELLTCLNLQNPKSFFLFAGAGSGKTRSLVNVLGKIKDKYGDELKLRRKNVAVITYTNAACDEIIHRLKHDPTFAVSTIHSFAWELIKHYTADIKNWLRNSISAEIAELEADELKGRPGTKTAVDRKRKIENKKVRLSTLDRVSKFAYNPNGNNDEDNSLSHTEVISISASFLENKPLFQKILIQKYPILLVDESQDTKKGLINALFLLQEKNKNFSLGLFGDTMQRIYTDGKENLGTNLPIDWYKPAKRLNHRCPKRVITLINRIRSDADGIEQLPRTDKEDGVVRLFIIPSNVDNKIAIENAIKQKMVGETGDDLWKSTVDDNAVKTLTLEHHMAAKRMNFDDLFAPLYSVDRYRMGLLDGSLPGIRFFTQLVLPLIVAKKSADEFAVSRIVRQDSPLFKRENIKLHDKQTDVIKNANAAVSSLFSLWGEGKEPTLLDILKNITSSKLFVIPGSLKVIAQRTVADAVTTGNAPEDIDESIAAWDAALVTTFDKIVSYNDYISDKSMFGTHQGVKGLQFDRVLAILDDEESRGFLFSYEKLFGAKAATDADKKNIKEGKETSIDRTRRLFYVICSRAMKSLAIVAYTNDIDAVKHTALSNKWFIEEEILLLDSLTIQ